LRDYDVEVDVELMASILSRVAKLDAAAEKEGQWGEFSRVVAAKGGEPGQRRAFMGRARSLISSSELHDPAKLEALWKESTPASLARSKDPLIKAALSLADRFDEAEARSNRRGGALARLRPKYFEMLREVRDGPIYPDANSTLRFSYASVRGYDKWDGATQTPVSSLGEAVDKHTGADPFDLPAKVRQKALAAKHTYWSDQHLGDLPLCFMADADTTGGNSGSPVIDGKGRLVGFNFDRVWENIAGDFAYFEGHSRNISADVRHLLWMLDEVDDAGHLLTELGVAKFRDAPAKPKLDEGTDGATAKADAAEAKDEPTTQPDTGPAPEESGGLCSVSPTNQGWTGLLWLGLLPLLRRRDEL
jgi:MYXO-CTERM domain-containing protein